jgi:tyrosyl-tRNA synthetase
MSESEKINEVLERGVEEVLPSKEALAKLMEKKKITLYQGFDPSMPSLHIGNLVGLVKLRQFQELGHKVIFLVGDFTGMIGDPTDKSATRKKLTRDEVLKNSKKWKDQVGKVLVLDGDNPVEIKFNSEWSDKISFKDLIEISSNFTVQQLLERDMFQERLKSQKPIHLHEFLYPLAQGYDSVEMDVDLEIGGSDQVFNMLAGRSLMKALKGKEKYVLTTKLMVDSQGEKIGKTTGNALFLDSTPQEFFGGIMSFPDEAILSGFELLTDYDLLKLEQKIKENPMQEKKNLAYEVTRLLWGNEEAEKAKAHFEKTFQEKSAEYDEEVEKGKNIADTVAKAQGVSVSEAKRLIAQGSVDLNDKTIKDPTQNLSKGDKLKIGKKKFVKIK